MSDTRLLLRPDSFDPVEMECLLGRVTPGCAFIDVGANCGVYALRMAAAGGRVVAIGDRRDAIRLAEGRRNLGSTRIDTTGGISADMRPLLDIVRHERLDRLSALKVDVEGFEDRVLAPFLGEAPDSLLPDTIIAELIWRDRWAEDWRQTAARRGSHRRGWAEP